MASALRVLHVLALGLWFGAVAFFSLAGLLIFSAFEEVARRPAAERPLWLPLPAAFDAPSPGPRFPDPLRLEQGSRAAGVAVGRVFPAFYALQAGAALVALLTAFPLAGGRVRLAVVALGLVAVLVGWWLEREVAALRVPRNDLTDAVLVAGLGGDSAPDAELVARAGAARAAFGMWHGISLLANFVTLALAGLALALAAFLPPPPAR